MHHTVVIGAGPGGLAAAAALKQRGVDALVLEKSDAVGSAWRRHYERLHLHTARETSHLPGFKIPREYGRWVARRNVVKYLEDYTAFHGLNIRFGVVVERIDRDGSGWIVRTASGDDVRAHNIVIATGHNHTPDVPTWPGMDTYTGELIHASSYRVPDAYAGKDVLVVGTGNTGAEIAVDLVEGGAARVVLAVRTTPTFVRRQVGPLPNSVASIAIAKLPVRLADRVIALSSRLGTPDLSAWGLPRPPADVYTRLLRDGAVPIIDVGLIDLVRAGKVEIVPAVTGFDGDKVLLADHAPIAVDAVIAATGYLRGLEPLVGHLGVLNEQGRPDFVGREDPSHPGLYFTGFTNPLSGMFRELNIDARRIAALIGARA